MQPLGIHPPMQGVARQNATLLAMVPVASIPAGAIRDLIVFCADYTCSHNVKLAPAVVDQWPNDLRLYDLEPSLCARLATSAALSSEVAAHRTMMSVRR